MLVYKEKFTQNRVALLSITQDLGESETADVMLTMMGVFDEYQSKETAKHVQRSMIENAKQGFWNGSKAPFGYQTYIVETRGAKAKKKIKINEAEAEIVRLIFQLYVFGANAEPNGQRPATGPLGVKQITTRLNASGFKTREGRPFRLQYIDKILRNTAYVASITSTSATPTARSRGRVSSGWRSRCRALWTTRCFTPLKISWTVSIR